MASWDPDAELSPELDYRLVHNTFVTLFWDGAVLRQATSWLVAHNYDVVQADAGLWNTADEMFTAVAHALQFPSYFGQNLDALNDCLSDVAAGDYGWRGEATGLVLVLDNFDRFADVDRRVAQALLNIVADNARRAMLIGNRLICLIQSNDPDIRFEPVGAMPVMWNDAEWPAAKRHPPVQ